jgi:transposase
MLPELRLTAWKLSALSESTAQARKTSKFEVCPKCATPSAVIYNHRIVKLRDAPVRGHGIILRLKKRRFFCKTCKKLTSREFRYHLLC